jgi:hypothetical protein
MAARCDRDYQRVSYSIEQSVTQYVKKRETVTKAPARTGHVEGPRHADIPNGWKHILKAAQQSLTSTATR